MRGPFHTNSVEGFFSILKRGITGCYFHVSEAHFIAIWPSSISGIPTARSLELMT